MSELCSNIVEKLESVWAVIGWGLFALWFLGPFFAQASGGDPVGLMIVSGALLAVWWLIDVVDQQVAVWQVVLGMVMLGIGLLPRGALLSIACWIIYWTRVRE
jgi:hypothetical protein